MFQNPHTDILPTKAADVTPNDTTTFQPSIIFVGGAGAIAVMPVEGPASVVYTVPAGATLPVMCTQVLATGTTATLIKRQW